ncbi:hypothetical protein GOQ30_17875 [Flavobacterium sp. TP390]|uniref:Uncharacterized protein n=1 Tax=Flavobacterium profundi TaxID=1774945 RepID=A0A6I4IW83_9FLAO|nr:hypothetical protein [Flavobacterium profundi]MVO11045.1 hypothetical protein [Flavobacterium profundi]
MREKLFELESQFQPFLLRNDYTFIGPTDPLILNNFYKLVNKIAPRIAVLRSIHHALSNRDAVNQSLLYLSAETELKIYVVISNGIRGEVVHTTISEYCAKNNIIFNF